MVLGISVFRVFFTPELYVHGEFSGDMFGRPIAECGHVDTGEQILSRAHEDGTEYQMQFVDQPGAKILLNGRDTAADSDIFVFCSLFGAL
jgi:hypothetical protein